MEGQVPRANTTMLLAAIDRFDKTVAEQLSLFLVPDLGTVLSTGVQSSQTTNNTSLVTTLASSSVSSECATVKRCLTYPSTPVQRSHIDFYGSSYEQLFLLACKVYSQRRSNSSFTDSKQIRLQPSQTLLRAFNANSSVFLSFFHLTPADCQAIGDVISAHHEAISAIDLQYCGIDDDCYRHLSTGLDQCRNLHVLDLGGNKLTECHVSHMAKVVQQNCTSLEHLDTQDNDITVEGYTCLHSTTHMCSKLQILRVQPRSKLNSSNPELYDALAADNRTHYDFMPSNT